MDRKYRIHHFWLFHPSNSWANSVTALTYFSENKKPRTSLCRLFRRSSVWFISWPTYISTPGPMTYPDGLFTRRAEQRLPARSSSLSHSSRREQRALCWHVGKQHVTTTHAREAHATRRRRRRDAAQIRAPAKIWAARQPFPPKRRLWLLIRALWSAASALTTCH